MNPSSSPCAKSVAFYRERGFSGDRVEQRIPIPGRYVTRDYCHFADALVYSETETVAIQACAISGLAAHVAKLRGLEDARKWSRGSGRRLEVWAWEGRRYRVVVMTWDPEASGWRTLETEGRILTPGERRTAEALSGTDGGQKARELP